MRKEIISIKDMQEMLGLSYATASKKIREVKAFSDVLGISGIIHEKDWQAYLDRFNKKEVDDQTCNPDINFKRKSAF